MSNNVNIEKVNERQWRSFEISQHFEYIDLSYNEIIDVLTNYCETYRAKGLIINHDKDDSAHGSSENATPHFHALVLNPKQPVMESIICNYFHVKSEYINKIKCKNAAIKYLIHANDKSKYQYNIDEITFINCKSEDFDFSSDLIDFDEHSLYWYQHKNLYDAKTLRDLEKCWSVYLNLKQIERNTKNMQVCFIEGKTGLGKTTLAKHMAHRVYTNDEIFISSSSNDALNGYMGQKCIIMDDMRGSSFSFSDLLKMLDNNTNSSIKSRYCNKSICRCEVIYITSSIPLSDFYKDASNMHEAYKQLYRRVKNYITLTKEKQEGITNNNYNIFANCFIYDASSIMDDFPYTLVDKKDITSIVPHGDDTKEKNIFNLI